jgi:hypothetical protein
VYLIHGTKEALVSRPISADLGRRQTLLTRRQDLVHLCVRQGTEWLHPDDQRHCGILSRRLLCPVLGEDDEQYCRRAAPTCLAF